MAMLLFHELLATEHKVVKKYDTLLKMGDIEWPIDTQHVTL